MWCAVTTWTEARASVDFSRSRRVGCILLLTVLGGLCSSPTGASWTAMPIESYPSCRCKCVGCPTSHEAAIATKLKAFACAVSFEAVLGEVEEAHCLIASFLGPDGGLGLRLPEIYMLRSACRRVRQISYYDVHWLRAWCWLCGCEGQFEHGAGCSMEWRQQAWICPLIFRYL